MIAKLVRSIAAWTRARGERVEWTRAEFNFASIRDHVPRGGRVLDVGAWNGYVGALLRDRLRCDVLDLDVVDAHRSAVPFQLFDGATLPVEARTFDRVLLLYVLHHSAHADQLLREARRALSRGGRLVVAEDRVDRAWQALVTRGFHVWLHVVTGMRQTGHFRTTDAWIARFRDAGFEVERVVDLGHHLGRALWPENVLFVLKPTSFDQPTAEVQHDRAA